MRDPIVLGGRHTMDVQTSYVTLKSFQLLAELGATYARVRHDSLYMLQHVALQQLSYSRMQLTPLQQMWKRVSTQVPRHPGAPDASPVPLG